MNIRVNLSFGIFYLLLILMLTCCISAAVLSGCGNGIPPKKDGADEPSGANAENPGTVKLSAAEEAIGLKKYIPSVKFKERPGLYVENGELMREGKPYAGIGVNFFGAFINYFCGGLNEYDEMFETLADCGIEYCRINVGLFWPFH